MIELLGKTIGNKLTEKFTISSFRIICMARKGLIKTSVVHVLQPVMCGSGMGVIKVPRSLVPVKVHDKDGKESSPHLTVKQPNEARKPANKEWNCKLHHSEAKGM